MRRTFKIGCLLLSLFLFSGINLNAQQWSMKTAPLMTPFAATIDTANVLGEYPRPQLVRERWLNLNGIWQYQEATNYTDEIPTGALSKKILVPFPVESAISGVMHHAENMWYRRTFTVPESWAGEKVLIHFGAVDYKCEVFINGISLGEHTGGYDPFTFDISTKLTESGPQEVTLKVTDPTDAGGQPRGKQTLNPGGIMYTSTSGIWQSVWLEPVPTTSILELKMIPDVDNSTLSLKTSTSGPARDLSVDVDVFDGTTLVTTFTGNANTPLDIAIPNPKLWSPDSPFLYDLKVTLKSGTTKIDSLTSYFGMRKISMAQVGDYKKIMLNNEFLFQFGPLDQGFWPDGLYTAPTDLAIKNDIQKVKDAGYNMIRKHIKVEPYRWYYWADKLGILVWQDMPSANSYTSEHPPVDEVAYKSELERMVKNHWNSPCIVMWVIFNESQGQHNTQELVADVKSIDPSRLINQASGGSYAGVGEILDVHSYPPPACPKSDTQILACGEYGGIGYSIPNHIYKPGFGYVMVNSGQELLDMYTGFAEQLMQFKTNNGLSAAVYTELTDVEIELNGFLTYDREITKLDINKFHDVNQNVIKKDLYLTDVLPTSKDEARNWKYTLNDPGSNWFTSNFIDNSWTSSPGGFGTDMTPGSVVKTTWDTSDIWLRQTFNPGVLTQEMKDSIVLVMHHDEDCEVYINGILATTQTGYTSGYNSFQISDAAKAALISNETNLIAIHCHQTIGGQYIDAGLSIRSFEKKLTPNAVTKVSENTNISVYPNPTHQNLNVKSKDNSTMMIGIYNIVGSEVLKLNNSDRMIDVSSLKPGLYFLRSETNLNYQNNFFVKD